MRVLTDMALECPRSASFAERTLFIEHLRRIQRLSSTDDTILFGSCFDANAGLFEALLDAHDAVISDSLNHASIIDGVRLCRAKRFRYANNDMSELERALHEARHFRTVLVVTDGVFSMDGIAANLPGVCDLANRYGASVMVDDFLMLWGLSAQADVERQPGTVWKLKSIF